MKPVQLFFRVLLPWLLAIAPLRAQTVDTDYARQVNTVFANLDKTRVPNKLLLDYAMEFAELSAYNGTLSAENMLHRGTYTEIYNTLLMARVNASVTGLADPKLFNANWEALRQPGKIVLSGLFYKYSRFKSNAVPGYLTVNNDKIYDKYINGVWQNPYEEKEVFAIAAPIAAYNYLRMQVQLPAALWYTNQGTAVQSIAIDFADGRGYQAISLNQVKTITYSQPGLYEWKYRLTLTGGRVLYSHTQLNVTGSAPILPRTGRTISQPCVSGTAIDTVDFTGTRAYAGVANRAILEIDYALNDCIIRKPLIVAEGFDSGLLGIENPLGESDYTGFRFNTSLAGINLLNQLNTYDIIYVNWVKGKDDLHRNAYLLEDIIKWVNSVKQGTTPNVVMGQSMGAVIGRYALRDMEQQQAATGLATWNHKTSLYISHDGPHQGANIPLSILYFARHLADQFVGTPLGDMNINPSDGSPITIEDLKTLIDSPGTRQLLINNVNGSFAIDNSAAIAWQNELHTIGYPLQTKNVAISNGNHCANPQDFEPETTLFSLNGKGKTSWLVVLISSVFSATALYPVTLGYASLAYLFNEPGLLLGILPGNSKFNFDFKAKALPDVGDNIEIYRGKITFTKKVLGLINLSVNLTNRGFNNPNGILSYDYYPGGFYPVPFSFDDTIVKNKFFTYGISAESVDHFNFIPVPSALDIGKGTTTLNNSDYFQKYTSDNPPLSPKDSPFSNFTTSYTPDSNLNESHISFNTRNGNWLALELDTDPGNSSFFDCEYKCDIEITGPAIACGLQTFSVPAGADGITWSVIPSSAGTISSGQNTPNVSILSTPGYRGAVKIRAVITSALCGGVTLNKDIWVGTPLLSSTMDALITPEEAENYVFCQNEDPIVVPFTAKGYTSLELNAQTQNFNYVIAGSNIYIYTYQTGTIAFTLQAESPCGAANPVMFLFTIVDCPSSSEFYYKAYPNPATDYINIKIRDANVLPASGSAISATLHDFTGNPVRSNIPVANNEAVIDVAALPKGYYILTIKVNDAPESHLVYIEK
ncbi:T9SS type A sorting domain-containing protein [Flavobacterium sp. RHBU_24]|uniref:T9SS type A sorting domain-containing protein n=1 Tax=Flavobacterium sp. RHBU_24 TaxID=3391185 RepID=UPI003985605B